MCDTLSSSATNQAQGGTATPGATKSGSTALRYILTNVYILQSECC